MKMTNLTRLLHNPSETTQIYVIREDTEDANEAFV